MTIENTEEFLKKFGYTYEREKAELIVSLPLSHSVALDFSNPESLNITNRLTPWNFLSGIFKMEIKYALLLNLIIGLLISVSISYYDTKMGFIFFIAGSIWAALWTLTYKAKTEHFKQFLLKWSQNSKVTA